MLTGECSTRASSHILSFRCCHISMTWSFREASGYHRSYQIKECDGCLKYVLEFQHNVFLKIFVFRKVIHQFKFNFLHLVVVKPRPQEIILYSQEHKRKGIGESYILNAKKKKILKSYFIFSTFYVLSKISENVEKCDI